MLPTEKATKGCILKDMVIGGFRVNNDKDGYQYNPKNFIPQHLYILSDEEIKAGDWTITNLKDDNYLEDWYVLNQVSEIEGDNVYFKGSGIPFSLLTVKKIIATTDPELTFTAKEHTKDLMKGCDYNLPRPSDAFLKAYCEKGDIDEVLVEYIGKQYKIGDIVYPDGTKRIVSKGTFYSDSNKGYYYFTNDNRDGWRLEEYELKVAPDNTITIKPVKNSWNREEVKNLLKSMSYFASEQTIYNGREYYMEYEKIDKWIEQNL